MNIDQKDIEQYLSEVKEAVERDNYRLDRNARRQDNINLFLDYVICILRRRTDTGAFAGGHSAALADIDFFCLSGYFSFNNDIVVLRYPFKHGVG